MAVASGAWRTLTPRSGPKYYVHNTMCTIIVYECKHLWIIVLQWTNVGYQVLSYTKLYCQRHSNNKLSCVCDFVNEHLRRPTDWTRHTLVNLHLNRSNNDRGSCQSERFPAWNLKWITYTFASKTTIFVFSANAIYKPKAPTWFHEIRLR